MSRGFVKEGDQEDVPVLPPRAHLPPGVANYVTFTGLDELLAEQRSLLDEKQQLDIADETERRIALNHINAKLEQLEERIATATVVDPDAQTQDHVWFGASVKLRDVSERDMRQYQIVGVDEADVSKGKISFVSPLAKALLGRSVGDEIFVQLASGDKTFEIREINYGKSFAKSAEKS